MPEKFPIETLTSKKVLAIGAHPDDLEFSAGGTLALLSQKNEVTILLATDGGAGTKDSRQSNGEIASQRAAEAKKAAEVLGVGEVVFFNYPDLGLRDRKKHFFKKLMKFMVKTRPDIVISWDYWGHYEPMVHPDHRTTAEVVMEVILEATLPNRLRKWGFANAKPLDPKPKQWLMAAPEPNFIVDITTVWEKKWQAIGAHSSQISSVKDAQKIVGEKFFIPAGNLIGVKYGEPFRILEM